MANAKSNAAEVLTLNFLLRGAAATQPAGTFISLHTADPTEAGGVAEVTGGSYARQSATFAGATTDGGGNTSTSNTAAINWINMPTATVTHVGIWSAVTGGTMLYSAALSASKALTTGDNFTINANQLIVSEN